MLQVGQNSCKCFSYKSKIGGIIKKRDIYTKLQTHKVNSCFGQEQLQMLHVGQNSSKCFIGGRALPRGIFTNSQRELQNPEQLHITWASAMHARACLLCMQYSASTVQFAFSQRKNRFTQKISFFKDDACFECQNDAVSKILQVTDTHTQTNILTTVTLCACTEG